MPTPKFEMPKFEMPKFEMPKFDKFEMPKFEMPKFDKFEMPKFEMPKMADGDFPGSEKLLAVLRDVAYAGTGLVALTVERITELNTRLLEALKEQLARVKP